MKRFILTLFSLFLILFSIQAQDNCTCCTEFHDQFDFWVGQWSVYDTAGNLVAENNIQKLEDNCLLAERWESMQGFTGRSYNYFNVADSSWNQVWIDNSGGNLVLKGKFMDGKMVLESDLLKGKKVDWYFNRITWTPKEDGSVTQHWEVFSKEGEFLTDVFKGIYKKK